MRSGSIALALSLSLAAPAADAPSAPAEPVVSERELLLGAPYQLEVSVAFHKGLLHWLDSLATLTGSGFTAGKTIEAHRREYERILGLPKPVDQRMLTRFREGRLAYAPGVGEAGRDGLTLAFLEAADLGEALDRASAMLAPEAGKDLADAMRHFEPLYRRIWRNGMVPDSFVARARGDARRADLASFLAGVARFSGAAPDPASLPQLVLVPVPSGSGTHAQAIGRFLLVEIRPGESLKDEVAPIVHENVHFLFYNMPPARLEALRRATFAVEPWGAEAWGMLAEALPTAIGQGLADRAYGDQSWSLDQPWYHDPAIDGYAKRIFPLVEGALAEGRPLDEALIAQLVAVYR